LGVRLTTLPWKKITVAKNSVMEAALPLEKIDYEIRTCDLEPGMCALFCKLAT
jgi:hypothetical protein